MTQDKDTIQDLLKPRYKVIATDTSGNFSVGDILILDEDMNVFGTDGISFTKYQLDSFPYLFEKLEWWEERKPKEMPKYVKGVFYGANVVGVLDSVVGEGCIITGYKLKSGEDGSYRSLLGLLPATLEEYTLYINQQSK